jgi:hypothetical protein
MSILKQAIAVLQDAEQRLRELVATGAAAGEYDAIQQITEWARILGAMVQEAKQMGLAEVALANNAVANTSNGITGGTSLGKHSDEDRQRQQQTGATGARRMQRAPAKGQYPKFFRQGDQLVKIGWSRTTKGEYEHKASRRVVDALTAAIAMRSRNGKLFRVEGLLPLKDLQDQREIPSYQAYVALAWLKLGGMVKQHGRRGYSIRKSTRLSEAAVALWQQLPEKS